MSDKKRWHGCAAPAPCVLHGLRIPRMHTACVPHAYADMRADIQDIFKLTPHDKQVMMFSATLSQDMRTVCKKFMSNVSKGGLAVVVVVVARRNGDHGSAASHVDGGAVGGVVLSTYPLPAQPATAAGWLCAAA